MKHVTIKDVAKALNCSVSTVSRAFNNKYDINPATRKRVLEVANNMGYSPNPIARKLTQKRTYNIGVVVPEFINPFFPQTIVGMQDVFLEKGYQVLAIQSNEKSKNELLNLKTLVENFVDGIIISLTKESTNEDFLRELIGKKHPLVLFNRVNESLPVSKVIFDDYKWMMFATEHLIRQGVTDLIYLNGPSQMDVSKKRAKGFIDAHHKHKLPFSEDKVIESGLVIDKSEVIVEKLIEENKLPRGFVCVNDPTAIGAIKSLQKHGYKVPEDVVIIGFSEDQIAPLLTPSLSSVAQPTYKMGKAAAELLLKQIEADSEIIPETLMLNGTLNIRDSSSVK